MGIGLDEIYFLYFCKQKQEKDERQYTDSEWRYGLHHLII